MNDRPSDVVVAGAGIFGVTAALELRRRGYAVTIVDEFDGPHPLAATTDISKVVRMEYGTDEAYMELVEEAIAGFRAWNDELGEPLFHESGVLMVTRSPMAPGGLEYESYALLVKRGHSPERLDADELVRRFPAWRPGAYEDGFYNPVGGFAQSGRLNAALGVWCIDAGVRRVSGRVSSLEIESGRVVGVRLGDGRHLSSARVLVAAGAWTPTLVPELTSELSATGHPVFHLRVPDEALFTPPCFCTFTADVARTGWYGFPIHPTEGVVKIASHGTGVELDPERDERIVDGRDEAALRRFLAESLPSIARAPIVYTRCCLYCDTRDGHFMIDRHPSVDGLTVASGGSGHGFKFAPVLGGLIADAVDGTANPRLHRFRWRRLAPGTAGEEAARFHGPASDIRDD